MKKNKQVITLVGMPTSGKSTIGKILANKLGWDFIDLDDLIKEKTGRSYDEILEQDGERKLLDLENKYTLELAFKKNTVFSPGGSIMYSPEAMGKIKKETKVVYIETTLREIQKRLKQRVIKGGIIGLREKGLKKLFKERSLVYKKIANHTINIENLTEIDLVEKILELA
ncbi:shikimate kinase [Patescibacteria group bacterium]|nr:shikimate kinase [Patescibacteria group bacterium]